MNHLNKSILTLSLFLVVFQCCLLNLNAQQVKVTVNIPPPYPIHLEDYLQLSDRAIVTVTNLSQSSQEVKLITTVDSDIGLSGTVKTSWEPLSPLVLNPMETKVLTAPELRNHFANLSAADFDLNGVNMDQIVRSESLPEGVYSVCVNAYTTQSNTLLSDEFGCARILLAHYDPPVVLLPGDQQTVPVMQPQLVNFTWSPSGVGGITRYSLSLVDMTESGLFNPNDAFGPDSYVQPFFTRDNLASTVFPYSVSAPPLVAGHTYAVQIRAYDPQGNLAFKNEGRSPVSTFTYKLNQLVIPPNNQQLVNVPPENEGGGGMGNDLDLNNQNLNPQQAVQICQVPPNFQDAVAISGQNVFGVDDVLKLGDHDLLLTQNINWNGKLLSGEGKIKNTWFRIPILVEFEDLEVNAAGIVIAGFAKAKKGDNDPVEWANDLAGISFGAQEVSNLMNKLLGDDSRVVEWPNTKNIGVSMPVGVKKQVAGEYQTIAIVGMHFGTGGSALNAVTQVKLPVQNDQLILGASGVCFDKNGFTDDAFLFLAEDYTIAPQKAVSLKLLEGNQENPLDGTYVNMTKEGYENLQIDGKIILSSSKVKPVIPNPEGVSASFKVEVDHFKNFILHDLTLPDFELLSLPGFQFGITNLIYDHSEVQNVGGMVWPDIGDPPPGDMWQGLYLESVNVKIPEKLNADTEFVGEHIIFDEDGFTGHLTVDEVFGTNQGKMGSRKWPFSMKDVDISVEKNTLTSAGFGGEIRVPIQKQDSYLDYSALITKKEGKLEYQFTVSPEEETEFPAIIAKAHIDPETHIIVKDDGNGLEPAFHFYGDLTLDTKVGYNVQGADFSFKSIEVNNFVVDKDGFHLGENGSIKYASPVKNFAGFSAGLDHHEFSGNDIKFGFWLKLSEESNVIGGTCGLTIHTNWENGQLKYKNLSVNDVSIKGDVGIATLDGSLAFKHEDPQYGNGFQGKLNIGLQLQASGKPLEIETNIMFGNKNNLKYFYFDGMVDNLPVGIPITASMRIWGFKGGFYHHMKKVEDTYVPDPEVVFGLLAGASIGLDEKNTFHAKILLEASFTSSGIGDIYFDGNGYMLTEYKGGFKPYETPTAVHLGVSVHYDFAKKIFDADIEASIAYPYQAPLVEGSGQIHIYADINKWRIKVGSPSTTPGPDPLNVTVLDLYTLKSYFMAGHELGGLPPPPDKVLEILGDAKLENQRKNGMLTSGKGLAFGSSVEISTGNLDWWIFYANLDMGAGFDVMLNSGAFCNNEPAGINGWYANGSAYAYFDGAVGLYFKFCKKCKERKIPLVDLSVAAQVEVGVPNPLWVDGYAAGSASILGIWEGSFDFHVQYGEYCEFTPVYKPKEALSDLVFIQDVLPREGSEDAAAFNVFGQPEVLLTFSTNEDKIYTMPQEDEDANEFDRYFKFPLKELVLSIDDSNSDDNGKVLARWGEDNHEGDFKRDSKGDNFLYKSDKILPAYTRFKLEVEVTILEKVNGQWIEEEIEGGIEEDAKTKEIVFFKTGKEPEVITDENVDFCYPGRFQRYYLEQDGNYVGYIKTKQEYQDMFDLDYENDLVGKDKIIVKLIPFGGGDPVEGEYLKYEGNRIFFRHPPLDNNKMYALQLIKEQPPSQWLSNAPDVDQGGGGLQNDLDIATEATFYDLLIKKQKLLGELKLAIRQRELYKYVFRTSNFDRLGTKITTASKGELEKPSSPALNSIVEFDIQEPFDEYDYAHLIDLTWNPEYKNAYWYNSYLKPHVYQDYHRLLEIAYAGQAQNELTTPVYMQLLGAVPKLSQAEVDAELAEEVIPNYGINIMNDNFVLSNGTNSSSPGSSGEINHKMIYFSEMYGNYTYKYLFMPKLYNFNNPVILNCIQNWGNCNPDLQSILTYHTVNDKEFRRISAGIYQTLVGYKPGVVNSWNTNSKFGIEWNVPLGFSN